MSLHRSCEELGTELSCINDLDGASAIDKLKIAQMALKFAIEVADEVAEETHNSYAREYLVAQLETHAGEDHGYLSRDFNFDKWIEELSDEDSE